MWILDSKYKSLQVKSSANYTTNPVSFSCIYATYHGDTQTPHSEYGNLTDSYQYIVSPPSEKTSKEVKSIRIYNDDSIAHTITFILKNTVNTNEADIIVYKTTLTSGWTIEYIKEKGWNTYNNQGQPVVIQTTSLAASLTDSWIFVGDAINVAVGVPVSGDLSLINTGAFTVDAIQGFTVTMGGTLTTTGNITMVGTFDYIFNVTGNTNVTFPTTGTLSTLAGAETITNKISYNGLVITPNTGVITTGTWNGTVIDSAYIASMTSAQFASIISDEVGLGYLVFNDSPTFTTQIITPLLYGSSSLGGNITINSTYHPTKGKIYLGSASGLAYNEVTGGLSIGNDVQDVTIAGVTYNVGISCHNSSGTFINNEIHSASNTATLGAVQIGTRSRGTYGTPLVVASGDNLFDVYAVGYDGTDYAIATAIEHEVDATVANNQVPGRIKFSTASTTGTLTERLRIDSAGLVTFANAIRIHSTTSTGATGTNKLVFDTSPTISAPILANATTNNGTAGALGYNGLNFYATTNTSNTGVIPAYYFIRQNATYTLSNSGSAQALFNGSANGAITLPIGTYRFTCLFTLSGMSNTSGNGQFSITVGTATIGTLLFHTTGVDSGGLFSAQTMSGSFGNAATSSEPIVGASVGTNVGLIIQGSFEVTVAGTVIPSFKLTTAIGTAVVAAGSFFECWAVGSETVVSSGNWS